MAFTNKDGLATGLSNSKAGQLGFPTSGEMNMSQGLTPPPQMQQTPYQHQGGQTGQQQPQDRGYMQPVQPFNEGMQTRGAQYDVTPSRVSPGVASFLRTDAVMKQSGAQRHDLVNRLDSLEKNQQNVIPGVDNMKLATLVQMAKARPQAQQGAIPQPVPGQQGIFSPQEQSMYAQAPDVGGAAQPSQEEAIDRRAYGHTGTAEELADKGYTAEGYAADPSSLEETRASLGGTAEEAAAKGFALGVDPSIGPDEQSMLDAKEIYSQAFDMLKEGGEIDQGMMSMANQQIASRERRLRAELAAQGGGASMVGNPALVQQNFNAARGLLEAKGASQKIRLAGLMQIARDTNNQEMADKVLKSKNLWAATNMLAQQGFDMDEGTAIATIDFAFGNITEDEYRESLKGTQGGDSLPADEAVQQDREKRAELLSKPSLTMEEIQYLEAQGSATGVFMIPNHKTGRLEKYQWDPETHKAYKVQG